MKSPVILRVYKGSQLIEVKQFDTDQIVIGHEAEVHIDLDSIEISPIHALIELRDSGYYICDLGSKTGTFKNGQPILDERLDSGDELSIGPFKLSFFVGVPKPKSTPIINPAYKPEVNSNRSETVRIETVKTELIKSEPNKTEPLQQDIKFKETAKEVVREIAPEVVRETSRETVKEVPREAVKEVVKEAVKPAEPTRPEIRDPKNISFSKKKNRKTFAPAGQVGNLREYIRPGKGQTVEVMVAWQDRIIETYHFRRKGVIKAGPSAAVKLPVDVFPQNVPLLEIGTGSCKVLLNSSVKVECVTANSVRSLNELFTTGKAIQGAQTVIRLDQNEVLIVDLPGKQLSLFIRFSPLAPVVPIMPPMLSSSELMGLVSSLVVVGILAFYVSVTTPKDFAETPQEDVTRTAQILFNNLPKPTPPPVAVATPTPAPTPVPVPTPAPTPKKVVVADKKKDSSKKGQLADVASKKAETGKKAAEVMAIPDSKNKPKKFTSAIKQGGAIKIGQQAGANADSVKKDMTKVGLFSAFGGGGSRTKLDTAYAGAGDTLGDADKATGSAGMGQNRAGDDLGSKFKDTGAGGKGISTQGIAGIGTKGRSSGQSNYGSVDGTGVKSSVTIAPGTGEEDWVGTIDKEAVRRVVRMNKRELQACYERELSKRPKGEKFEGKVTLSWEIAAKGRPQNAKVKATTLNNSAVENCMKERLLGWAFPEPPEGMTAEVAFPFYFKSEN